jgi:hypothetical protein
MGHRLVSHQATRLDRDAFGARSLVNFQAPAADHPAQGMERRRKADRGADLLRRRSDPAA